jgi:hypothetical protein
MKKLLLHSSTLTRENCESFTQVKAILSEAVRSNLQKLIIKLKRAQLRFRHLPPAILLSDFVTIS